jgi:hypothetical protein
LHVPRKFDHLFGRPVVMATLDPNHWTAKVTAAWKAAAELASEEGHAETMPLHVAIVLLEDTDGLARQVRIPRCQSSRVSTDGFGQCWCPYGLPSWRGQLVRDQSCLVSREGSVAAIDPGAFDLSEDSICYAAVVQSLEKRVLHDIARIANRLCSASGSSPSCTCVHGPREGRPAGMSLLPMERCTVLIRMYIYAGCPVRD